MDIDEKEISYNPGEIESKWQKWWDDNKLYSPDLDTAAKPFYNLMMFPYPSAEGLHVGNAFAFAGADVYGRFKRMQGYDVFEPMGLDGFGIHSENYALKIGKHPMKQAEISEANFYRQLHLLGNSYDWTRTVETYKPDYYRWTQWLFVQLFKAGLAYRKKALVNFCPSCKTVLADEQVIQKAKVSKNVILNSFQDPQQRRKEMLKQSMKQVQDRVWHDRREETEGVCERCDTPVEKKELEQWFFRITQYAERLLNNIPRLNWTEKVKIAQQQWIGKSEGATIRFPVIATLSEAEGEAISHVKGIATSSLDKLGTPRNDKLIIEVFTTRPDTLFGATFIVLSPEHRITASLLSSKFKVQSSKLKEIRDYIHRAKRKTEQERITQRNEKTGVFTTLYAINPVNNEKIPIWIADYVLMSYGTGAIMGVPAHDERDFEFANKYDLPIRQVIIRESGIMNQESRIRTGKKSHNSSFMIHDSKLQEAYTGGGVIVNSNEWNGWKVPEEMGKVIHWLEKKGIGKREVHYHLRDWLISRQRYWGAPIPMIFCDNCAREGRSWFSTDEAKQSLKIRNSKHEARNKLEIQSASWRTNVQNNLGFRNSDFRFPAASDAAGWYPVPEDELPVELPYIEDFKPLGTRSTSSGQAVKSPLANHKEFYDTTCPNCGAEARRETDVSDTFLDSAWYFLRYLATERDDVPFPSTAFLNSNTKARNPKQIQPLGFAQGDNPNDKNSKQFRNSNFDIRIFAQRARWLPVDMYVGGAEHSVLHLLYARFITMFLSDLQLIHFEEPFSRFYAHGLIIKEGAKMSKSRGNVVVPDEYIKKFGADTLRLYLLFLGPFGQGGDFRDTGIEGMARFVRRVWKLISGVIANLSGEGEAIFSRNGIAASFDTLRTRNDNVKRFMHKTIKKVTEDIEHLRYNTAIAALMEYYNFLSDQSDISHEEVETFLKLLAPFAPHITEELYQQFFGNSKLETRNSKFSSIHLQPWPSFDPKYLEEDEVTIVVQVNGKMRDTLRVRSGLRLRGSDSRRQALKAQSEIEERASESQKVRTYLEGKRVRKVIYIEGKILNFVVDSD